MDELITESLIVKMKSKFNEIINLQAQTQLYEAAISNWQRLADGDT